MINYHLADIWQRTDYGFCPLMHQTLPSVEPVELCLGVSHLGLHVLLQNHLLLKLLTVDVNLPRKL